MILKQKTSAGKNWRVTVDKFSCCDGCCIAFEPYTPTYWLGKDTGVCFKCATKDLYWAEETLLVLSENEKKKIAQIWELKAVEYFSKKVVSKLKSKLFR
jgi:hypothetical protein